MELRLQVHVHVNVHSNFFADDSNLGKRFLFPFYHSESIGGSFMVEMGSWPILKKAQKGERPFKTLIYMYIAEHKIGKHAVCGIYMYMRHFKYFF